MRTDKKKPEVIFFTLIGILGVMLLFLPHIGHFCWFDHVRINGASTENRRNRFTDTKERRPEIGDIVTYQVGETRVTHRVIRKEHKGYVTKGDANNREDPTVVTADQIIGKVIFSLPCLGYVAVFVRQRTIFGILTVMILQEMFFLLILMERRAQAEKAQKESMKNNMKKIYFWQVFYVWLQLVEYPHIWQTMIRFPISLQ